MRISDWSSDVCSSDLVWLARRATKEVDDLLKPRLDRISREVGACRRDVEVVLEALSLFVRYQLTVTAPLPEADSAARAVGNERFERFIAQLGRQIAGGKRPLTAAQVDGAAGGAAPRFRERNSVGVGTSG